MQCLAACMQHCSLTIASLTKWFAGHAPLSGQQSRRRWQGACLSIIEHDCCAHKTGRGNCFASPDCMLSNLDSDVELYWGDITLGDSPVNLLSAALQISLYSQPLCDITHRLLPPLTWSHSPNTGQFGAREKHGTLTG